ncbi:MAG: GNAT family N-acetyltransferase [Rhodobacteraceae bacterium]|nr:GNAT family N-acetyltransferase [Paracoccaceae bacterium]
MKIETIPSQETIVADRMVLRPLRRSDEGLLTLYAGDERVARNTRSIPHPLPPGASSAFVETALSSDRTEDVWAMDGSAAGLGEVLGVIGLERMSEDRSEVGYWVAPAFWNTGFATEALTALLDANPQKVKTVFAEVFQTNTVSAHVLTNVGFAYIGDAEAFSVAQGRMVQTWTYLKKLG